MQELLTYPTTQFSDKVSTFGMSNKWVQTSYPTIFRLGLSDMWLVAGVRQVGWPGIYVAIAIHMILESEHHETELIFLYIYLELALLFIYIFWYYLTS